MNRGGVTWRTSGNAAGFSEGELAFRRGDLAAAWDWHSRAWVGRREEYPPPDPGDASLGAVPRRVSPLRFGGVGTPGRAAVELQPTQALNGTT
ncbi:MAG: hypothetical protein U1F42_02790 [Candidatus Competibacteraceae bacterium]